jgi:hypothetical protein
LRHVYSAPTSHLTASRGDEIQNIASRYRLKTRVDEDGTKIIPGKFGHLYLGDYGVLGVMVMPVPPRRHYWGHVRKRMLRAGFVIVQDGDDEGAATCCPTNPQQIEIAIRAAGVVRRRRVSRETKAHLASFSRSRRTIAGKALRTSETTVGAGAYVALAPNQERPRSGSPAMKLTGRGRAQ